MLNTPSILNEFSSVREEAEFITDNISKDTSEIAIIIDTPKSRFYSAIRSELQFRNIPYCDHIKPTFKAKISHFLYSAIFHWIDWQSTRNVTFLVKFCNDLVTLNLISEEQFVDLNKSLSRLVGAFFLFVKRCLDFLYLHLL